MGANTHDPSLDQKQEALASEEEIFPAAQTAQGAAKNLLDAATRGDTAIAEARCGILNLAAGHPAFLECLIGALALVCIEHHGPEASSYYEAELAARRVLWKLFPELAAAASCIVECGAA